MGYHVRIINNNPALPSSKKALYNINELADILLINFNLIKEEDDHSRIYFYHPENEEFVLFYEKGELLAITTNESLIELMICMAKLFDDGSAVVGDQGEIYHTLHDVTLSEVSADNAIQIATLKIKKIILGLLIPIILAILSYIFKI